MCGVQTHLPLETVAAKAFAAFPEVFQGVQVGLMTHGGWTRRVCLIVAGQVAAVLEDCLQDELAKFFEATWRPANPSSKAITDRYVDWMNSLNEPSEVDLIDAAREFVAFAASTNMPPPPPNRTSLIPAPPGIPSTGSAVRTTCPSKFSQKTAKYISTGKLGQRAARRRSGGLCGRPARPGARHRARHSAGGASKLNSAASCVVSSAMTGLGVKTWAKKFAVRSRGWSKYSGQDELVRNEAVEIRSKERLFGRQWIGVRGSLTSTARVPTNSSPFG